MSEGLNILHGHRFSHSPATCASLLVIFINVLCVHRHMFDFVDLLHVSFALISVLVFFGVIFDRGSWLRVKGAMVSVAAEGVKSDVDGATRLASNKLQTQSIPSLLACPSCERESNLPREPRTRQGGKPDNLASRQGSLWSSSRLTTSPCQPFGTRCLVKNEPPGSRADGVDGQLRLSDLYMKRWRVTK